MIGATVSHFKVVEKSRDREIQISGHRLINAVDQWENEQMNQLP